MYCVANIVIQVFVNRLGTDYVAAWGTFGKIDAVFWMVVNAFSIAITTFVGQNYGAGKTRRMRKSVRVCLGMSYSSAILLSGLRSMNMDKILAATLCSAAIALACDALCRALEGRVRTRMPR